MGGVAVIFGFHTKVAVREIPHFSRRDCIDFDLLLFSVPSSVDSNFAEPIVSLPTELTFRSFHAFRLNSLD